MPATTATAMARVALAMCNSRVFSTTHNRYYYNRVFFDRDVAFVAALRRLAQTRARSRTHGRKRETENFVSRSLVHWFCEFSSFVLFVFLWACEPYHKSSNESIFVQQRRKNKQINRRKLCTIEATAWHVWMKANEKNWTRTYYIRARAHTTEPRKTVKAREKEEAA